MACKPICTPCFRPGFHIARRKQASHPGGRNGVQYANARLSGLVIHQSHRCIEMACNALEYIFAALLDAPQVYDLVFGLFKVLPDAGEGSLQTDDVRFSLTQLCARIVTLLREGLDLAIRVR